MDYIAPPAQHMVLCADCGTPIQPNNANLCLSCLRNSVDITESVPKQATVNFCRNCERYLSPPSSWVPAQLESRELLAICLRKLKGLSKVRLIDAGFVWTEPHSKRLRVKLTVQKEVFTSTILQQIFEVEFVVQYGQCPDCTRLAAKNTWRAMVQVRQKVTHKRTFLYLEQLILKHNAHKDTISIQEKRDGLDFYYSQRAHAVKMVEFLGAVVPIRAQKSEQVVSMDVHSSTVNYKFTYSIEIAPICKDDLVCLPPKLARSLGNIGQLLLCYRVTNSLRLIDPSTLQTADITAQTYFKEPFPSLAAIPELIEFLVLDIEPSGVQHGKFVEADAQVSPMTGAFGEADAVFHTRTHLGALLQPGDTVMGYHLRVANFNNTQWDTLDHSRTPDVVLVKKSYPNRRKKSKARTWKLKSIAKEAEDPSTDGAVGRGALGRRGGLDSARVEADYELFLRDLEEDEEMRAGVNLYRDPKKEKERAERKARFAGRPRPTRTARPAPDAMDEDGAEDGADAGAETDAETDDGMTTDGESEWGEDAPRIRMDELLDDFEEMGIDEDEPAAPAHAPAA